MTWTVKQATYATGIQGGLRCHHSTLGLWYLKPCSPKEYAAERLGMVAGRALGLYCHQVRLLSKEEAREVTSVDKGLFHRSNHRQLYIAIQWGGKSMRDSIDINLARKRVRGFVRDNARITMLDQVICNGDRHCGNIVRYRRRLVPIDHAYGFRGNKNADRSPWHTDLLDDYHGGYDSIQKTQYEDALYAVAKYDVADAVEAARFELSALRRADAIPIDLEGEMLAQLNDTQRRVDYILGGGAR